MKTNYEDILRNRKDEEIWILAQKMVEEEVVQDIINEADLDNFTNNCCMFVDKISRIPVLGKAAININLFCGMLADSFKKEYSISKATKCIIIAALAYLVLPVDMIPDMIPVLGMLDDAHVLLFVAEKLGGEFARYKEYLAMKNEIEFRSAMDTVASEGFSGEQNMKIE